MLSREIRELETQPNGDSSAFPAPENIVELEELGNGNVICHIIGAVSREEKRWVGVSIMDVAHQTSDELPVFSLAHPSVWYALNRNTSTFAVHCTEAERAGWIIIQDGFALPTQQLVDLFRESYA